MKAFTIAILLCLCFVSRSSATNLRGQVVRYNPNYGTTLPVPGITVNLYVWNGQQWFNLAYAVTGNDGLYYFYNVSPGATFQIVIFNQFRLQQAMGVAVVYPPYFEDIPVINA